MHNLDPATHLLIQIIMFVITLVIIPLIVGWITWAYQRNAKKADVAMAERLEEWHKNVDNKFSGILNKITGFCQANRDEHDQLFDCKNDHANRITTIETTHHQRGCDQPYMRRLGDPQ